MNLSLLYSFWSFFFFCTNSVKLDLYLIWSNTCDKTFLTPNKSQTSLYQLCRWGGNTSSNSEELFTSRVWLMSEPTVKSVLVPTTKSPALLLNLIARRTQRTQNPDNIASPWLVSRNTPFFFKTATLTGVFWDCSQFSSIINLSRFPRRPQDRK